MAAITKVLRSAKSKADKIFKNKYRGEKGSPFELVDDLGSPPSFRSAKETVGTEKKKLKEIGAKIEKELRKASKSHKSQSSALAKSTKAHKSQADRIAKLVKEKLSVEEEGVEEKKLTAAEKKKKEDIIMALKKQKGGKKKLEPVDYAVATDRAKKLAEKNEK